MLKKGPVPAPVRKLLGTSDSPEADAGFRVIQRAQYPLSKEYSFNHMRAPGRI